MPNIHQQENTFLIRPIPNFVIVSVIQNERLVRNPRPHQRPNPNSTRNLIMILPTFIISSSSRSAFFNSRHNQRQMHPQSQIHRRRMRLNARFAMQHAKKGKPKRSPLEEDVIVPQILQQPCRLGEIHGELSSHTSLVEKGMPIPTSLMEVVRMSRRFVIARHDSLIGIRIRTRIRIRSRRNDLGEFLPNGTRIGFEMCHHFRDQRISVSDASMIR
mmetsp:Transcript_10730/g.16861  ORF Transcript_10730/g.16861 Transcript_10730/m.16861 type:complete len:216 (+) Transcript_10730:122-769(+)